ncbi:hypothetical protein TNCV_5060861 [Trichonephila clavipes]|nr:hypothetical protein TNCV_5060861 [Trichonephila clavipes]
MNPFPTHYNQSELLLQKYHVVFNVRYKNRCLWKSRSLFARFSVVIKPAALCCSFFVCVVSSMFIVINIPRCFKIFNKLDLPDCIVDLAIENASAYRKHRRPRPILWFSTIITSTLATAHK